MDYNVQMKFVMFNVVKFDLKTMFCFYHLTGFRSHSELQLLKLEKEITNTDVNEVLINLHISNNMRMTLNWMWNGEKKRNSIRWPVIVDNSCQVSFWKLEWYPMFFCFFICIYDIKWQMIRMGKMPKQSLWTRLEISWHLLPFAIFNFSWMTI